MRFQAIKYNAAVEMNEQVFKWHYETDVYFNSESQKEERAKNALVNQFADEFKPGVLYLYKNAYPDIKPGEHLPFSNRPARKDE